MPYSDPDKKKEADKRYADDNRDAIRKRKAKWYQENKERVAANVRNHRREVAREKALESIRTITNQNEQ